MIIFFDVSLCQICVANNECKEYGTKQTESSSELCQPFS